ncbi:hypothetical protein B9T38_15085 [Acinetobacter sp. ANC 4218]|nr:hypothetical protein B9T38_15085 [Acinetobacter sp. ANC 4218]
MTVLASIRIILISAIFRKGDNHAAKNSLANDSRRHLLTITFILFVGGSGKKTPKYTWKLSMTRYEKKISV